MTRKPTIIPLRRPLSLLLALSIIAAFAVVVECHRYWNGGGVYFLAHTKSHAARVFECARQPDGVYAPRRGDDFCVDNVLVICQAEETFLFSCENSGTEEERVFDSALMCNEKARCEAAKKEFPQDYNMPNLWLPHNEAFVTIPATRIPPFRGDELLQPPVIAFAMNSICETSGVCFNGARPPADAPANVVLGGALGDGGGGVCGAQTPLASTTLALIHDAHIVPLYAWAARAEDMCRFWAQTIWFEPSASIFIENFNDTAIELAIERAVASPDGGGRGGAFAAAAAEPSGQRTADCALCARTAKSLAMILETVEMLARNAALNFCKNNPTHNAKCKRFRENLLSPAISLLREIVAEDALCGLVVSNGGACGSAADREVRQQDGEKKDAPRDLRARLNRLQAAAKAAAAAPVATAADAGGGGGGRCYDAERQSWLKCELIKCKIGDKYHACGAKALGDKRKCRDALDRVRLCDALFCVPRGELSFVECAVHP